MPRPRDIPRQLDLIDQVRTLRRPPKKTDDGWIKVGDTGDEISPAWQNSWTHFDPDKPVSFFLDSNGIIRIRGRAAGGTNETVAFTLPEGYRPEFEMNFISDGDEGDGISRISVAPNGDVTINTTGRDISAIQLRVGESFSIRNHLGDPIFRVDEDGSVHILTGNTVQADL